VLNIGTPSAPLLGVISGSEVQTTRLGLFDQLVNIATPPGVHCSDFVADSGKGSFIEKPCSSGEGGWLNVGTSRKNEPNTMNGNP
jgi:hypothetical protein